MECVVALDIASICRELHILPGQGGLLEQDSYHVFLLKAGLQALHERDEKNQQEEMKKARSNAKVRR